MSDKPSFWTRPSVIFTGIVLGLILLVLMIMGPAGIQNQWRAWKGSAYGSDWLVVKYSQDGEVICFWELKKRAIDNESGSDGIFFVTDGGSVTHISGHYNYVQNPTDNDRYLMLKGRLGKVPEKFKREYIVLFEKMDKENQARAVR